MAEAEEEGPEIELPEDRLDAENITERRSTLELSRITLLYVNFTNFTNFTSFNNLVTYQFYELYKFYEV